MTCDDFLVESGVIQRGNGTPEMSERCQEHRATCVTHGGVMPSHEDLEQIFRDMFALVGHQDVCKGNCKCDDDPPSYFMTQVVKQFRNPEKKAEKKA